MAKAFRSVDHWTDRTTVTLTEAAAIAGKSYSWAWNLAGETFLQRANPGERRILVTTVSLARELQHLQEMQQSKNETSATSGRSRRRIHLRLIVDNDSR